MIRLNFTFVGLMVPVFSIFNDDLSLNTDIIPKYADYLLNAGYKGVLATSGEGPSLSVQERKMLAEAWALAVRKTGQHLQVQIGGVPFPGAMELARHADSLGVDSMLVMPHLYYKPQKVQELVRYMKIMSAQAPYTPIMYNHDPSTTGVDMDMEDFLEEGEKHLPNLAGIKFTSDDLAAGSAVLKAAGAKYRICLGGDLLIAQGFASGFTTATGTLMNVFPKYAMQIVDAVEQGDLSAALEVQANLTEILKIITKNTVSRVAGLKLAMNIFTPIKVGKVRPPLQDPTKEESSKLKKLLEPFV